MSFYFIGRQNDPFGVYFVAILSYILVSELETFGGEKLLFFKNHNVFFHLFQTINSK